MYNIKAVSKILDMPTVTIRAWETRYEAITPERTDSGHRVYTEENLNDLKWLKKQVHDNGLNVSQAVKLLKAKKEQSEVVPIETPLRREGFEAQVQELYEAVLDLNADKCNFLLDLYFTQFPYKTVFFSIIVPLMYKVGTAWERGELHVAKEHMISNIVMQRSLKFFSIFETSPSLPKVMAICPSGEQHQLGLILFTLFLREKHYPVYYIGADTPLEGLGELINEKGIEIVALSTSRIEDEPLIQSYINTLQIKNPNLKFIVGGLGVKKSKADSPRWDIAPTDKEWLNNLPELIK
ncbi:MULTISPECIES: MerR family transcriptional regulator [Sutcliffiella]|uniref:MerR family transcriptional regulator n=1 Tax=Sutcliffiella cohnii TaxID=33932 RepID=A0A223KXL9_9BACI|nr:MULTISPECIES: MerR family transcriptional regulator [Sutcliffiella]AST94163.1 MerR family transcriptional regulator [Sutcliffiella cohnii]MED4017634.1 MerR family transcriptional regulator [Sutcliffiella cohnii]WBL15377.1 MerR family transcriptional regulator [Sutcliffiella sp. NC1]